MAKISSTIYLESRYWNLIEEYQKEFDISSRNDALATILHEWSMMKKLDLSNITINVGEVDGVVAKKTKPIEMPNEVPVAESKKIDPEVKSGILNLRSNMKD